MFGFAKDYDPDQDKNVGAALDSNRLALIMCNPKGFFEKVNFEKKSADDKKSKKKT